jgi:hypothetical protein
MLRLTIFIPSHNTQFQPPSKTSTNKGIVRMHLPDPAQDATLWICSIGRKTEDNRKAIGIQCRFNCNSLAKDAQSSALRTKQAISSKKKLAEGDNIIGRCVGEDVGRKQAGSKCPAQSKADSLINCAQL